MAKNEIRFNNRKSFVQLITNNLNKHGEIRGKSKKETRNLRAICFHHRITKKGKVRPSVYNNGEGFCICEMCGKKFPTHFFSNDETKKACKDLTEMLTQSRFMAEAADLGNDTKNYLAKLSLDISHFKKTYAKIRHVVEKSDRMKKNRGKGNRRGSSSETFGSWR